MTTLLEMVRELQELGKTIKLESYKPSFLAKQLSLLEQKRPISYNAEKFIVRMHNKYFHNRNEEKNE